MIGRRTPSVARFSQADWVEAARLQAVMNGMQASQWPALACVLVLALLMRQDVPAAVLYAMLALTAGLQLVRHCFVRGYRRRERQGRVDEQLAYLRRHRWYWALKGLGWGLWPLLFNGRVSPEVELACWTLIAGVGGVGVAWMSTDQGITRIFLATFLGCLALAVALEPLLWPQRLYSTWDLSFPLLLAGYAVVLARLAGRVHKTYNSAIDLTYHNARLIESLQAQTRAAEEAARFKDRFLAGAAHDLKQPVNALGIYAEWLSNEPELVDELGPKILQSTQAINTLFDSLFDLVKIDAGRFTLDVRPIDIDALLADLTVQYGVLARQKGLKLRVRSSPGLALRSDPILLRRILGNLLANAIRYTAHGGVLLAARRRGQGVQFEVWDSGPGIPHSAHAEIYEEFYKVQTGGTEEGLGLGLFIVRRLCAQLGYGVTLQSRPGRGTLFRVTAPAEPDAAVALRS